MEQALLVHPLHQPRPKLAMDLDSQSYHPVAQAGGNRCAFIFVSSVVLRDLRVHFPFPETAPTQQ
jgi:hypothetical protein